MSLTSGGLTSFHGDPPLVAPLFMRIHLWWPLFMGIHLWWPRSSWGSTSGGPSLHGDPLLVAFPYLGFASGVPILHEFTGFLVVLLTPGSASGGQALI